MLENIDSKIHELIIGYLTNNNTPEENKVLHDWLKQSEENKKIMLKLQRAWQISTQTVPAQEEITKSDLNKVHAKLKLRPGKQKYISRKFTFIRIAASVVFLLGIFTASLYFLLNKEIAENKLCRIVVPKGSKTMAQLPDGSTVWLNAESTMTYDPVTYNKKNRNVKLVGEGYFSVATNPKKPFIVEAKNFKVKAFGTEFNVKSYPEDVTVETTLIHGIVKVEGGNSNNKHFEIKIKPKQNLICYAKANSGKTETNIALPSDSATEVGNNKAQLPVLQDNVKTVLYTSWKDDRWIVEGERIGDLAVKLGRRYNVAINFKSEDIKNYMFTGTFQNETLEQVMQIIKLTAPITYKIGKGEVTICSDERLKPKYEKYID